MRSAHPYTPDTHPSARRRATAFLLALAAHLLIVILLLRLSPAPPTRPPEQPVPTAFRLLPDRPAAPAPAPRPRAVAKARHAAAAAPPAPAPVSPVITPKPITPPPPRPAPTPALPLFGGKGLFDAADIGKLPSHPDDRGDGDESGSGGDSGRDTASVYGPGEGSGGQRLYDAEWYREPTHAELSFYLPASGAPLGSWAMVACHTIADFHVDNCRSLGESPLGSGLARALREAAWQFRIRPPRIGGRALVGAWVRIRIDFTETGEVSTRRRR